MIRIQELRRLASPAPRPQSLAWDGTTLWMGSRQTKVIHAIEPTARKVGWTVAAPGTPYGMTVVDRELRVLCGEGADDRRIIRRCRPGEGFDGAFAVPCPEDTGSQPSYDGRSLVVSQWYPRKLIVLADDGRPVRVIAVPHEICGQVFLDGVFYLVTTDAEETTDYWLTRVDPRPAEPTIADIAHVPFAARALAFDGRHFWTNHRDQDEIVCFARPD